jgi:hypothetical protein
MPIVTLSNLYARLFRNELVIILYDVLNHSLSIDMLRFSYCPSFNLSPFFSIVP